MTTTTVSVEEFKTEAERRLIETFELAKLLGVRSRETVWQRVRKGTLPPPIFQGANFAVWDRDAIPTERS